MSPANASVFGLLNFALDGVKLFSKVLQTTSSSLLVLTSIAVMYVESVFLDAQIGLSDVMVLSIFQLSF